MQSFTRADYEAIVEAIRKRTEQAPTIGLVLGSGLGKLADTVEGPDIIEYGDLPNWPQSTVAGHSGRMYIGNLEGKQVVVLQGRVHHYEGYSTQQITLPMRVLQLLGVETVILTNAAGGLNKSFSAGDLMIINDHISMLTMPGNSPLRGPNDDSLGPRFPGMVRVYDPDLRALAHSVAQAEGIELHEGVYICLGGPQFESPAEIRMMRTLGADAVGMSTAPEAIVARHGSMRVLGISSITNIAIDSVESSRDTTHKEVLEVGRIIVPKLTRLLRGVLREM